MFEVLASVLQRDSECFLSQFTYTSATHAASTAADQNNNSSSSSSSSAAAVTSPKYRLEDGVYYIERDWWLFRYILAFLRDGTLPTETPLLIALYREANFYGCTQIQSAIEEKKVRARAAVCVCLYVYMRVI